MFIPVCRPLLPTAQSLLPYLRRLDEARYYTNHGALSVELSARLGEAFGLASNQVVLAASGTAAIIGALLAAAGRPIGRRNLCAMPAFTFVATAVAAVNCGYEPLLVDIDAGTWAMDAGRLAQMPGLERVGAVIAVAPCGRPPDLDAWQRFSTATGIAAVVDAAACFDTLDKAQLARCDLPVALSLHATKTMSTAEGGLILCRDAHLIERAARALNFGFHGSRDSIGPSINGKISEYHAAVGLAELDGWQAKRAGFLGAASAYRAAALRYHIGPRIITDCQHASPYAFHLAGTASAALEAEHALERQSIDTRRWYGAGLHRQPVFAHCARTDLPVTDDLAARLTGLPFAADLGADQISRIVAAAATIPSPAPPVRHAP